MIIKFLYRLLDFLLCKGKYIVIDQPHYEIPGLHDRVFGKYVTKRYISDAEQGIYLDYRLFAIRIDKDYISWHVNDDSKLACRICKMIDDSISFKWTIFNTRFLFEIDYCDPYGEVIGGLIQVS
jgi:hypothetical protein